MKKKALALLLACSLVAALPGCGGETHVSVESVQTAESAENSQTVTEQPQESGETAVAAEDRSQEIYDNFLFGDGKTDTDKYREWYQRVNHTDYFSYEEGASYTLEELILAAFDEKKEYCERSSITSVKYAYLDCGADGVPELAIQLCMDLEDSFSYSTMVFKNFDGKLQMTYQIDSSYRSWSDIVQETGVVSGSGAYSYALLGEDWGYLNADGEYHLAYSNDICYYGQYNLDERFSEAIQQLEESDVDLYFRAYSFQEYDDTVFENYEAYEQARLYCGEKEEGEESNGIDFEKNVKIMQSLCDASGVRLYSLDEIHSLIAEKEKELGVTEAVKNGKEVDWKEYSLKDSWKQAAGLFEDTGMGPQHGITLPFKSEVVYNPANYPDLEQSSGWTMDDVERMEEGIGDMKSALYEMDGFEQNYANGTSQMFFADSDDATRIVSVDVYNGCPEMDAVMKQVGYEDYYVTYTYTYGIWRDFSTAMNKPLDATLVIGDNVYYYLFSQDQLVCRFQNGDEGTVNAKSNNFINNIYKLGCYYGNVINADKGRYSVYMMDYDQIQPEANRLLISAQVQGYGDTYTFVVDEKTIFAADCDYGLLSAYEGEETPLEWMTKLYSDQNRYASCLLGMMEIRATENHVDEILGISWWD